MSISRHKVIRSLSVKFSPGHEVPSHQHDWSQLIYATSGTMRIEADDAIFVVPTRRAIWVPGGFRHRIFMQGSVHLQTIYLREEMNRFGSASCTVISVPPLLHELVKEICRNSIVEDDSIEGQTLIRFFKQQLNKAGCIPLSIPMPRDERARRFAARLIADPGSDVSFEDLAKHSGSSLRSIQRLFQKELVISVSQWRNKVRMLSAVEFLSTDKSVTEIALDLGFESPSSFIHAFRKFFGESPGQFRKIQSLR